MSSERAFPILFVTRHITGLVFLLAIMWYAGASQSNGAAYLLFFLLGAVFLVSAPHTLLNLTGLTVTAESVKPTFAGQEVLLPLEIVNESRSARHAIAVSLPGSGVAAEIVDEIPPGRAARVLLRFSAPRRGEHEISSIRLASSYPLGFLQASRRVAARQRYLVYPKPAGNPKLPSQPSHVRRPGPETSQTEGDDFAGVRPYVPGESQRHIDWKAVARGQAMMTKQFAAETEGMLYLDFAAMPARDTEQRLSQLALWVIEAERARRRYGLRLPSVSIPPALGEAHFHKCLQALALCPRDG
jgi:uncharacterized protein (DUF58 family)